MRTSFTLVAAAAAALPALVTAQEWSVQVGGAGRVEYTDNYFFASTETQSAYVTSVTPFVTATRRTESSEVTALLAVGANLVTGTVDTTDYVSGRLAVNGSQRFARSTWSGNVSLVRVPALQSEVTSSGVVLTLAYSDNATVTGAYTYALDDAWSLGATVVGYGNRYEAIEASDRLQDNHGYAIGGTADFRYSDRTRFTSALVFLYHASDLVRNDAVTATLGVVHEFSPQFRISASAGGYWLDPEPSAITSGQRRSGFLYGGSINYDFSDRTRFVASLSQSLSPSGVGVLTKNESAIASLSHVFSERLTGRIGAGYARTTFPAALGGSFDNEYFGGELGASYRFAERWTLDAGYRYARAKYAQSPGEPTSNYAFVSVSYNWPGASITDWVGSRQDAQGMPGAGPVPLPDRSSGPPDSTAPGRSPFDQYWIP